MEYCLFALFLHNQWGQTKWHFEPLSVKLNQLDIGCCIGDKCLNNLMYADDICCFASSFKSLHRLVDTCVEVAAKRNIVFNCTKTIAMYFPCKFFKTTDHNLTVNDQHVEFVNSIPWCYNLAVFFLINLILKFE